MHDDDDSTPNARFWVWECGGWVKLTLRPGDSRQIFHGGPTEEGYYCESVRWTHEGEQVRQEYATWSTDCDGPHSYHCERLCPLGELRGLTHTAKNGERFELPVWRDERDERHDMAKEYLTELLWQ